MLLKCH